MAERDDVSPAPAGAIQRLGRFLERVGTPAPTVTAVAIPKRQARPVERKMTTGVSWVGAPDTARMLFLSGDVTPDAQTLNARTAMLSSAYAFAAIDWRARKVAEAPLWVARETADGVEWIRDHRLAPVLTRPRPDMSLAELLDLSMRYRDTTGRCVWVAEENARGEIVRFAPFSGAQVRTKAADGLIFGSYQVEIGGHWETVPRDRVIDFRELLGGQWHTLTSRLEVALGKINLGHSVDRMLRNFMLKAMFPGGIVSSDPKWNPTDEDWDKFKNAIAQWYGGPANAGVPLTLQGGATFSRVASGAADLVPAEVLDRVEATVGATFGVPPIVLGFLVGLRNSPWSQAEQMDRQAHADTIGTLWARLAEALTASLLTEDEVRAGYSIRFDTSGVKALQEDEERRARIATMNAGIWTVDERREYTGKEKLEDERGETIAGLVTFGDPFADGGFDDPLEDDEEEEELEDDDAEADPKSRRKALHRIARRKARAKSLWTDFDTGTKANEPAWASAVLAELQTQRAAIVKLARETFREGKAVDPDSADRFRRGLGAVVKAGETRLRGIVEPLLLSTGGIAVRQLSARIGVGFDLLQPGLGDFAKREAAFLADVMGETTGRLVAATVERGLKDGDTVSRMIDRLMQDAAFSPDRATLVARTETTRAWNGAQRESASRFSRESGRTVSKTWLSAQDDRVRDEHIALNGEQRGINEAFSNGLQAPGEPNCRCTLTYAVSRPIE